MKNTSLTFKAAAVVSSVLLAGTYVCFRAGLLNFSGPRETAQPTLATPAATQSAPVGVNLNADGPLPLKPPNQNIPIETHGPREKAMIYSSKSGPVDLSKPMPYIENLPPAGANKNDAALQEVEKKPAAKPILSGSKSFSVDLTPPTKPATTPKLIELSEEDYRRIMSSSKSGKIDLSPPAPAPKERAIMLGSKSAVMQLAPPAKVEAVEPQQKAQSESSRQQRPQTQRQIMSGSKSERVFKPGE